MTTADFLKRSNIRPSTIRIAVYEYLRGTKVHPAAEEIYGALLPRIPTLSKTSVYNTVRLFSEKGIAKCVTIDGVSLRYDADTSPHGHFFCEKCGGIYDFCVNELIDAELSGFDINYREIYFGGICRACKVAAASDKIFLNDK